MINQEQELVGYNDELHTYTFCGVKYRSVTSIIAMMEKHVDFKQIAVDYVLNNTRETIFKKLAKSWNISVKEAKEKWGSVEFTAETILQICHDKSNYAKHVGKEYHSYKENLLKKACLKSDLKLFTQEIKNDIEYSFDLSKLKSGVYPEIILYNHKYKVAGKADLCIISDKYVDIEDHKTSEKIEVNGTAYFDKSLGKKVVRRLVTPLNHLEDTNYTHYALQLSAYGYMLEVYGFKPRTLTINHVIFENKDLGTVKEIVPYKVPYLRNEVIAMFKHQLNK